jgi:hypothetical protein
MHDLDDRLTEALLLDLLDMPISFHRCFIAITGRLTAALLLSHLWWVSEEASAAECVFRTMVNIYSGGT